MLRGSLLILLCANFVTSFQPFVSSVSKITTRVEESKQHPSSSIPNVIRNQRIRTWSPYSSALFSSPDSDLEMINEDGEDDEFVYVTAEPFESEADIAQAANELAATNPSIELKKEIERSFLQYALSIILGRALPDARDGLKPVHRRILYAMHQLNLAPSGPHRKCARVVGEVLGKYHPHGDMAVYDALVRMAQDFTTNYRLIDGHGNFGSVDADPAAAMRYTECRLTKLALDSLMTDLSENTVDLVDNFDGNEKEPLVLPSKLPLLLLNGSSGCVICASCVWLNLLRLTHFYVSFKIQHCCWNGHECSSSQLERNNECLQSIGPRSHGSRKGNHRCTARQARTRTRLSHWS